MKPHGPRMRDWPAILIALVLVAEASPAAQQIEPPVAEKLLQAMEFRNIGPYRGGRVTAVTGVVGHRNTFYMGSTGGGVWRSTDGGQTWKNLSDGHLNAASIGAVAVASSDPNVLYVGTGSACPRGNISPGDGVYRSTDAGKTWTHTGLREAGQIGRIRIHPDNPDRLYVAALGHIFGPNEERGVFRSSDGGRSWEKVLYVSDKAGAVDLAMSPGNPRILFAAIWQVERKPWTLNGGGDDSGLYRSADGGDTWEELTEGLPQGIKGRIGVAVSGANPDRIWALVEAEDGGLYRSEDGGESFKLINSDRNFRQRAWYYTHVYADPQDSDTVYILNVGLWRSVDGGKSFDFIRAPHGDHHDLWIDPDDSQILINGNDGGANVSLNGGMTWSTQANQPTAEMYRVTVDGQFPYRVYGCQQDNSCVSLPSRTSGPGIARQDWWVIGGCESGHVAVDPRNPEITYSGCYGGSLSRYDHATDQDREIMAYPEVAIGQAARDLKYRFQWNAPTRISPHDPRVLYHTSQHVHRSTDEGQTWQVISPDLTRNDPDKQDYAGGPITLDNTGVEVYGTVFAFEESPHSPGLLWAGSDDGLVHLSRDNGASWNNITPRQMPDWGQVNSIELSAHDPGRAFLAVTRYRFDDFTPFIFRTDDYGASWQSLTDGTNGIPAHHFVRVVREDPDRRGLLYAGTEFGLYVSFDDGRRWQPLQLNLPVTPVTDLAVTQKDLVVATQGRSFWILDDLTPLHQMGEEVAAAEQFLFQPRTAYRFGGGFSFGGGGAGGENPKAGAWVHYFLASQPEQELRLEILNERGQVLRSLSSEKEEPRAPNPWARFMPDRGAERKLAKKEGLNRYVWDLRLADPEIVEDAVLWGAARGPKVPPGSYQVRLTLGEWSETRSFEVRKDPRLTTTDEELEQQFDLSQRIWQGLTDAHQAIGTIRDVRDQVESLASRLQEAGLGDGVEEAAQEIGELLTAIEESLHQTKSESSQDVLNYPPQLDGQLLGLFGVVQSADAAPTAGSVQRFAELRQELDGHLAELDAVLSSEIAAFNDLVRSKEAPPILVPRK